MITRRTLLGLAVLGLLGSGVSDAAPSDSPLSFQETAFPPGQIIIYPTALGKSVLQSCLSQRRACQTLSGNPYQE